MQQDILINWSPQETRVAVIEHGAVQELHVERALERGLVGNIYLGKVARVLPGMQSAFIDIGLERAAFLHVADVWQRGQGRDRREEEGERSQQAPKPIEKLVFEGQTLMVQVIKDPLGSKGARLSTHISIAGRLMVHLPRDDGSIGVSQKIALEQRDVLRQRVQQLMETLPPPMAGPCRLPRSKTVSRRSIAPPMTAISAPGWRWFATMTTRPTDIACWSPG